MPYRTRIEPEPELPDPAVEAYARRVAADRRRAGYRVVEVGVLVTFATGALVAASMFVLGTVPERRMTARWRDALGCFDDGHEVLRERVRARQLAAIGEDSAWPSRCRDPLFSLSLAAAAAGHDAIAQSAEHLARVSARADLENEDLVVPAAILMNDGARAGLRAIDPVQKSPSHGYPPLLSDLLASAGWTPPPYWPDQIDYDRCLLDDEGHHLTCGVPLGQPALTHSDRSLQIQDLPDGKLGLRSCDNSWTPCPIEPLDIGHPPIASVAWLGTKLVLMWAPMGTVGGIRMRIAERGMLANGRTRVILDDRIPGDAISAIQLRSLVLIGRGEYVLLLLKTADGRDKRSLALRLDVSGELSTVSVSLLTKGLASPL